MAAARRALHVLCYCFSYMLREAFCAAARRARRARSRAKRRAKRVRERAPRTAGALLWRARSSGAVEAECVAALLRECGSAARSA